MKIAVSAETHPGESRVAATPDTVKAFVKKGMEVAVEAGAGAGAFISDDAFAGAGAKIGTGDAALKDADILLSVRRPEARATQVLKKGAIVAAILDPYGDRPGLEALAKQGLTLFAMELMPRITRAQSMDVLSSQANLAGYKAVIDAAAQFGRAFPMMMTAAGTVPPAKVFIMGVGRRGTAGNRHRAPAGRDRFGDRRPQGDGRAGQEPRRQVRLRRCGRCSDCRRLCRVSSRPRTRPSRRRSSPITSRRRTSSSPPPSFPAGRRRCSSLRKWSRR